MTGKFQIPANFLQSLANPVTSLILPGQGQIPQANATFENDPRNRFGNPNSDSNIRRNFNIAQSLALADQQKQIPQHQPGTIESILQFFANVKNHDTKVIDQIDQQTQ